MLLVVALALALPPEFAAMYESAQSAPPELAAYAMLRMVESGKVVDPESRRELIDTAWERSQLAREANPRKAITGVPPNAIVLSSAHVYQTGFDRLSLGRRAIVAALRFDAPRARAMFESFSYQEPRRLDCSDSLWDDVSPYFRVAAEVSNGAYSRAERRTRLHLSPLLRVLRRVQSPLEATNAIEMVNHVSVTAEERQAVVQELAAAIERIQGDDRSFSNTLDEANRAVKAVPEISAAWREYLRRHFASALCAESADKNWPYAEVRERIARQWSLDPEQIKPRAVTGSAKLYDVLHRPGVIPLLNRWSALMKDTNLVGPGYPKQDRPEWQEEFDSLVKAVEALAPLPDESVAEYWTMRNIWLEKLAESLPAGRLGERFVEQQRDSLENSPLQHQDWIVWMWRIREFPTAVRSQKADLDYMLWRFEESRNQTIALWGRLVRTIPGVW